MQYAGDVSPEAAAGALADGSGVLVDCRTRPEWAFVGVPVAPRVVFAEWSRFPDGALNPSFLDELAQQGVDPTEPVYFLCRSGQRSRFAAIAATAAGYSRAFNVSEGFEGPLNGEGRRTVAGWKAAGLPWRQT